MTTTGGKSTLVLDAALFPDAETLNQAEQALAPQAQRLDLTAPETLSDGDWDNTLAEILAADRVLVL